MTSDVGKLFQEFLDQDPIPLSIVRTALSVARDDNVRQELFEVAEEIVPGSGDYLPFHWARGLVRAEVLEEAAREEITSQKEFIERLSNLAPALFKFLRFETPKVVKYALCCVDDCFNDFKIASKAPRQDRQRRVAIETIGTAFKTLTEASSALRAAERHVDIFVNDVFDVRGKGSANLEAFLSDVATCQGALEICLERAHTEPDFLILGDNQAKTSVVRYAHTLCVFWGGPPLTTSPNSDFATFCSLLFEVASGIPDESLSGAIIRYARSKERLDMEAHEHQKEVEDADLANIDNFEHQKYQIATVKEKASKYIGLVTGGKLSENTKLLLLELAEKSVNDLEAAKAKYGPHLILDGNRPLPVHMRLPSLDDYYEAITKADIAIGRLRRRSGLPELE